MKSKTISVKASELLKNGKVAVRISDLQADHQKRHEVTIDTLTEKLEVALSLAIDTAQPSAAVSAIVAMSRLHGLSDRDRAIKIELPKIECPSFAMHAIGTVIAAVSNGKLTPSEGKSISNLIENYRRTLETMDLELRITNLENGERG